MMEFEVGVPKAGIRTRDLPSGRVRMLYRAELPGICGQQKSRSMAASVFTGLAPNSGRSFPESVKSLYRDFIFL
jgi:hypothetical protein